MAHKASKTVWASPDLWADLDARAEVERLPRNALVRRILQDYVDGRLVREGGAEPADASHGVSEIAERLDALQLTLDLLADPETPAGSKGLAVLDTRRMSYFLLCRLLFIAAYDFVRIGDTLQADPVLNERVKALADQFLASMAPIPPEGLTADDPLAARR